MTEMDSDNDKMILTMLLFWDSMIISESYYIDSTQMNATNIDMQLSIINILVNTAYNLQNDHIEIMYNELYDLSDNNNEIEELNEILDSTIIVIEKFSNSEIEIEIGNTEKNIEEESEIKGQLTHDLTNLREEIAIKIQLNSNSNSTVVVISSGDTDIVITSTTIDNLTCNGTNVDIDWGNGIGNSVGNDVDNVTCVITS